MVLVTGGLGFIGSHVCRKLLEQDEHVVVFDNFNPKKIDLFKKMRIPDIADKIEIVNGDVRDADFIVETLKKHSIKKIIHTAAITFIPTAIKNPILTFNVNTVGTFNLLEASRVLDIQKFVYISTASTYGDFQYVPADEKHPLEPKDIYGATKAAADRLTCSYYKTYGLPATIIRTSSVYGPGDLENRAAKTFIEKSLLGEPMELHGGGTQRRDFSFVKDVANGMVLALNSKKANGEVFNITGGTDHSIKDLATTVQSFIPKATIREVGARKVDINRGQLDISKARKLLNYQPKYNLKAGIKEYIKWFVDVYMPSMNLKIKNQVAIK